MSLLPAVTQLQLVRAFWRKLHVSCSALQQLTSSIAMTSDDRNHSYTAMCSHLSSCATDTAVSTSCDGTAPAAARLPVCHGPSTRAPGTHALRTPAMTLCPGRTQNEAATASSSLLPTPLHRRISSSADTMQQLQAKPAPSHISDSSSTKPLPAHGPWARYQAGLQAEQLRHDVRQEVAMKLLQRLYVELQALHPHPRKRSGSNLTMFENVAPTETPKRSWCDPCSAICKIMPSRLLAPQNLPA